MTSMIRTRGERQATKLFQYDSRGKKPWTAEEDQLLKEITEKYGTGNWTFIAQHFTERTGKQCRERWHNHLNPGIKKGEWTAEEDEIIMSMQQQWGNQWAKITSLLPGRTDNAVKNRYHATLRASKGKRVGPSRVYNTTGSSSSGSTTVELDMDMDMDLDEDDENTFSTPISSSISSSNIVDGKISLSTDVNMMSMKNLNTLYPQAHVTTSSANVTGTFITSSEAFPMGTVVGRSDCANDSLIASSPVPSDSICSIDMMDWNSCGDDNHFIPLEIDIDGLRDWVVNEDDIMEDCSNIDEDSPRRDSSCFARMKNEAVGFCQGTVRKVEESYEQSKRWRIGGVTTALCGDRLYMQDLPSKQSSGMFCGVSYPF